MSHESESILLAEVQVDEAVGLDKLGQIAHLLVGHGQDSPAEQQEGLVLLQTNQISHFFADLP